MEPPIIAQWTFVEEVPVPQDIGAMLVQNEQPYAAFRTYRDTAIFTNKRLIVRDAKGITGKKVEVYSLPYNAIVMWSSENAGGVLDFNADLELWTKAGHVRVKLGQAVDIRRLDSLIAYCVMNG
ncbi:MAG: PH domain-containing protein [Actinomycetaceae bacterium]|nr:PH domain-containing protein [Actinomycetaceae bacterium]